MNTTAPAAGSLYGCEQTGKREWRAWVYHDGKRHWIGCRDNQADAFKAAGKVYWSLRGRWDGTPPPDTAEQAPNQTEGMPKAGPEAQQRRGLNRNAFSDPLAQHGLSVTRPPAATQCAHCGRPIYRPRGRFCSDGCKQSAYRMRRAGAPEVPQQEPATAQQAAA